MERIEQAREEDPKTRDSLWYGLSELAATVGDFSRAFETARRIQHPWSRWQALRALARRGDVPKTQRDALLEAMESAARAVDSSDDAEGVLLAINVYWLGQWGQLERAVREARQLSATGPRIQALYVRGWRLAARRASSGVGALDRDHGSARRLATGRP